MIKLAKHFIFPFSYCQETYADIICSNANFHKIAFSLHYTIETTQLRQDDTYIEMIHAEIIFDC